MAGGHMKNLVETAASNDAFKTLVAAVKAAGLVGTLAGKGPFTVFAPTDEAFAKLPDGTVESLLKPENKEKLISILTYHVIPGKVMSKDIKPQQVSIKLSYGKVSVEGASVTAADVEADNGVIHIIDTVILPKS
ncbi:MAG: fasciclin domain-containing protein [bacterium]